MKIYIIDEKSDNLINLLELMYFWSYSLFIV